jgi:glycerophosphoryl diester phosphodiesterase
MNGPLLIAHRGESHEAPENSLAAVRLAWVRGARAVEIDVRRSADGELVVIHDADTRRIGGPRRAVAAQTAEQLASLDAGSWKHPRWAGERVPLLGEVLASVPARGRLFIELKEGPECVPPLVKLLARSGLAPRQVLMMSFAEATVAAAAAALPHHEVALLLDARRYVPRGALASAIERAKKLGCRALDVGVHRRLDAAKIAAVHAAGLRLYVWTVDRVSTARRLAEVGIDGITTNRCAWLAAQLDAAAQRRKVSSNR